MSYAYYGEPYKRYGDASRLYGAGSNTNRIWIIEIDWDNDTLFNGDNEAYYCTDFDTDRGWLDVYNTAGSGYSDYYAPPAVGRCIMTLSNHTGRFDVWDSSGAPTNIMPGRRMRVRTMNGDTDTAVSVFTGFVVDIKDDSDNNQVIITAHDGVELLQEKETNIALSISSITNDEAFDSVISAIGYPWGSSFLLVAAPKKFFWSSGRAITTLHELAKDGNKSALFWVKSDGAVVMAVSEYVAGATSYNADVFLKDIEVSLPWQNLKTVGEVFAYQYEQQASAVMWQRGDEDIYTASSSSVSFWVDYNYENSNLPFVANVPSTIPSSDFAANSSSDGLGTNLSANFSVTVVNYGKRGFVTITNTGAAGYMTTLDIYGVPYTITKSSGRQSVTDYLGVGENILRVDSVYRFGTIDSNSSLSSYNFVGLGYPHANKRVTVKIQTRAEQFARDLMDLVQLNITQPYLAPKLWDGSRYYNTFRIDRIRHKWLNDNGQDILTTWTLRHVPMTTAPTF